MQEFLSFLERTVRQFPRCFCTVQHNSCTEYVCLYKDLRVADTSVYMAFCREMYHAVDVIFRKNFGNCFFIADISLYKCIILSVFDVL